MIQTSEIIKQREEVINFLTDRLPAQQVKEVRSLLAKYFLEKGEEEFDQMAQAKNWSPETYKIWLQEHNRNSYK